MPQTRPSATTSSGFVLLPVGIALTTTSHLLHGLGRGLLLGASIGAGREKGQGWLPSRDGDG